MQKVLSPIIHKDAYTRAVESELLEWLRETIWTPLLIDLFNFDVPVSPQYQAIKYDETGRANAGTLEMYRPELGSLGVKRGDMPQIASEAQGALINFLAARGITFDEMELRPGQLKPTQEGFYREAVERAKEFLGQPARALLVSIDGYLLDGHHRWTAALIHDPDTRLRCFVFSERVRTMLKAMHEFPSATRENATETAVTRALMSGRIHYADGVFSGKFNAEISKELHELGALFNAETKTFRLAASDLPAELTGAVVESLSQAKALHQQVIGTLDAIQANVVTKAISLNFTSAMDAITEDLNRQFTTSLVPVTGIESVTVHAEFTPAMRKGMTEQLTNNLDLSIKDFASERIPVLRELVEKNALEGMRTDQLAKIIEAQFGVSKRKAAFLADQETGLATAKYRQLRYADLGVQEYIWSTSKDNRVRAGHRALEGRRFNFNSPPVCDPATGRRCNPGEDYRCRCAPKPIVSFIPVIPES